MRKIAPLATGLFDFFPDALAYVARVSKVGNTEYYGQGTPMKIDLSAAADADALLANFLGRGTVDPSDNLLHTGKMAWRGLALLQQEIRQLQNAKPKELTPEEAKMLDDEISVQVAAVRAKEKSVFSMSHADTEDEDLNTETTDASGISK